MRRWTQRAGGLAAIVGLLVVVTGRAQADPVFESVNFVTDDQSAHAASITDPNLKNAWGISHSSTSPFWVSDNGSGVSTLYNVDPATGATTKVPLTVTIPGDGSATGQVFNGGNGFNGNLFLFASEDGTVSGWRGTLGTTAETLVPGSNANVYKGLALETINNNNYIYAANFRAGTIDVFKGNPGAPNLTGTFTDPTIPVGFAPFNIQALGSRLYVTYAMQNGAKHDDVAGLGNGYVSAFDAQGNFLGRISSQGTLNSPWGLALAPASFGTLAGDLLVGNFGDGHINAFNLGSNTFVGQLLDASAKPLAIDGLWGLTTGNDGGAGSSAKLYFTAGPDGETHGLFGEVRSVPEPSTLLLGGIAAAIGLGSWWRRRKRAAAH